MLISILNLSMILDSLPAQLFSSPSLSLWPILPSAMSRPVPLCPPYQMSPHALSFNCIGSKPALKTKVAQNG